ncbi:MAG: zinc ribbon domain-containing protein [Candidatus Lokiarchaeota archaeon]|nr:zinc ribbon domain-containing protein [Candidatus Lokiarchaeota archaeon]
MALPLPGTPIIVDIGSAYVKIGFSGEPGPRYVFPCITGTEKYKSVMVDVSARSMYVGNDVSRMRGVLKISHPIQRGAIMDWDSFFEILNYIFYSLLRVESLSDYPVFYCESPFMHKETKEYIARLLFETHGVKSLIMMPTPLLSLFSVGLTTGLVIESGEGLTWVAPIINGVMQEHAVQKIPLAGIDVNNNLKNLLMREGVNISSSAADEIIQDIKEKNCYFIIDPNNPPKTGEKFSVTMPDGSNISIANHVLYQAPEVLFNPSMLGITNVMNFSEAVIASLRVLDNQYWHDLLSHIVFSGGNLSYSGFEQRFHSEMNGVLQQLGSIPRPKPSLSAVKTELIKLQAVETFKKQSDTCSQCGEKIDLSTGIEYCPSCGVRLSLPEIKIDLSSRIETQSIKGKQRKCPYCRKEIQDSTSLFCPYCGKSVESIEQPKISKEKTPAQEFVEYMESSSEVVKFFIPDNFQFAIFNGAAILGSLPSFQKLFITHEQFKSNHDLLYRDISEIL